MSPSTAADHVTTVWKVMGSTHSLFVCLLWIPISCLKSHPGCPLVPQQLIDHMKCRQEPTLRTHFTYADTHRHMLTPVRLNMTTPTFTFCGAEASQTHWRLIMLITQHASLIHCASLRLSASKGFPYQTHVQQTCRQMLVMITKT